MALTLRVSRFKTIPKVTGVLIAVFALMVQPMYGLVASQVANAIATTPSNMQGWTTAATNGGTASFDTSGAGALKITLANGDSRVRVNKVVNAPLNGVSNISFRGKLVSGPEGSANTAFRLGIDYDGAGPAGVQWIVYETYYNFDSTNPTNSSTDWQDWNVKEGKFWGVWNSSGDYATNKTLAEISTANPSAVIKEISVGMGQQGFPLVTPWVSLVDSVSFNGEVYDFEPATATIYASTDYTAANGYGSDCDRTLAVPRCGSVQAAIDAAQDGDTIKLIGNFNISTQINVNKKVTIDGMGGSNSYKATLYADFNKAGTDNNSVFGISVPTTIRNLTVDGNSHKLHGINVYQANDVNLNDVAVINNGQSGINVNGSAVTVTNITTANNGWHGINVDQGEGVTTPAVLTVKGTSTHTGEKLGRDIFIDDRTNAATTVVEVGAQYVRNWDGNGYTYTLDVSAPTVVTTVNDAYNPTDIKVVAHDDQRLNRIDVSLRRDNGVVVQKWWGEYVAYQYKNDRTLDLSADIAALNLPEGQYTLRATVSDALGKTTNAANVNFTIDRSGPSIPTGLAVTNPTVGNGAATNSYTATVIWNASTDSFSGIKGYEYWVTTPGLHNNSNPYTDFNTTNSRPNGAFNEGQGAYTFKVRAQDNAGIWSDWSTDYTVTYDSIVPEVTIDSYGQDGNTIQPTVSATDDGPLTYAWTTSSPNVTPSSSTVLNPTFTASEYGVYTVTLTVTDAAGNTTVRDFSFTYGAPVPNPAFTIADPTLPPSTAPALISFSTVNAGSTASVLNDNGTGTNSPAIPSAEDGEVLGTSTTKKPAGSSAVLAASSEGWKIFGAAWYWWLLVLAAAVGAWLWFAAAIRRRREQEA